jgi:DNA (cytosine-5)-methyltransferase 1
VLFYNSHEFIKKNNPRYFIFENVKGLLSDDNGKTFQRWIDYLGGKSINGNPVIFPHEESTPYHVYYQVMNAKHYGVPQNRERIFIIGIRDDADNDFSFPKPFHLIKRLKDVLENEVDEKYFLSDKMLNYFDSRASNFNNGNINFKDEESVASTTTSSSKSLDISDNIIRLANVNPSGNGMNGNVYGDEGVSPTLSTNKGEGIKIGAIRGRNPTNPLSRVSRLPTEQMLEINENGTSNAFTTVQKDNVVIIPANNSKGYDIAEEEEDSINFSNPNSETRRGRVGHGVSQTLDTACNQGILTQQRIRRLTPFECFRLMDFNENFKWNVSDSQAYKQAGNSIAVSCLVEIIKRFDLR